MHDIAITQKYIVFPVIARTTSDARLQVRRADVGVGWQPAHHDRHPAARRRRQGRALVQGAGAQHAALPECRRHKDGKITMDLPTSSGERDPSQMRRWTFDMKSRKNDTFDEEVISTANGVLARMDDRYLSLPYKYCYVGNRDPSLPFDKARAGGMGGFVTNQYLRVDVTNPKAEPGKFFVGPVQGLQESCFVPRKGSTAEGDGYLMGIASNYETMSSDLRHRRRAAHGRGRDRHGEAAVPPARRHAHQLVRGERVAGVQRS